MVVPDEAVLVSDLQALVGDSLRSVATYTRDGYDVHFIREDVRERVDDLADDVHEDLVLQQIGSGRLEDLFQAGELQCSMHRFETMTAFHFADGQYTGLFVGVDSDVDLPLATLVDTCTDHL